MSETINKVQVVRPIPRSHTNILNRLNKKEPLECSSFEKIANKQCIERTSNSFEKMIGSSIVNDVELYNNLESVINNSFSNEVGKCIQYSQNQ